MTHAVGAAVNPLDVHGDDHGGHDDEHDEIHDVTWIEWIAWTPMLGR